MSQRWEWSVSQWNRHVNDITQHSWENYSNKKKLPESEYACVAARLNTPMVKAFLQCYAVAFQHILWPDRHLCLGSPSKARVTIRYHCPEHGLHEVQLVALTRILAMATRPDYGVKEYTAILSGLSDCSHFCHNSCSTPGHFGFESHAINVSRKNCAKLIYDGKFRPQDCKHVPACRPLPLQQYDAVPVTVIAGKKQKRVPFCKSIINLDPDFMKNFDFHSLVDTLSALPLPTKIEK